MIWADFRAVVVVVLVGWIREEGGKRRGCCQRLASYVRVQYMLILHIPLSLADDDHFVRTE